MPSASVATTSPEIGPSIVLQISTRISSGSPDSFASRLGLVVMPSTTPSVAASRISLRLAVSRKIFMIPLPFDHGIVAFRAHGRVASTGSAGALSLPAWSNAATV